MNQVASSHTEVLSPVAREHIVILGGGFGGWYTARHLSGILPIEHRITLVDRVDYMLYMPAAKLPCRVRFLREEIESVDAEAKTVELASGEVLHATQLVLALGATTSYHEVPGAQENSFSMKTLSDANSIRERLDALIVSATRATDGAGQDGYTGVESVAALYARMREQASRHGLPTEQIRATLVEPLDRIMKELPESLASYSKEQLEADGIRVILGVGVKAVAPEEVELTNGERLPASLLVWDTGIEPSALLQQIDVSKGKHHGVIADAMFRVPGRPGVWAIGDCAEIPDTEGGTYSPTAQNASREGVQVARNIVAVIKGRPLHPFRFVMLGQLALIAKKDAVADILGVRLRGFVTWILFWAIYISKLPDNARRVAVLKGLVLPEFAKSS